jgi:hypothetical protein
VVLSTRTEAQELLGAREHPVPARRVVDELGHYHSSSYPESAARKILTVFRRNKYAPTPKKEVEDYNESERPLCKQRGFL